MSNLKKIYPLCDTVNIYDNSDVAIKLVAYTNNGKLEKVDVACEWRDELLKEIEC